MFNNRANILESSRVYQTQLFTPPSVSLSVLSTTSAGHSIVCQNQTSPAAEACFRLLERLQTDAVHCPLELQRQCAPRNDKSAHSITLLPSCMDLPLTLQRQQAPVECKYYHQ